MELTCMNVFVGMMWCEFVFPIRFFEQLVFVWYSLILRFVNRDHPIWPKEWIEAVDILARHTPILITSSLAVELDAAEAQSSLPQPTILVSLVF